MSAEFAGGLRQRVALERRLTAFDRIGGASGDWVGDGAAWARITSLPAESGEDRWAVLIRARAGLGPDTRLHWRDQLLCVEQVEHDPQTPDRMRLICRAVRR